MSIGIGIGIGIAIWIICGWLAYGLVFAYFQREYPILAERDRAFDAKLAMDYALDGPLGLIVALCVFHRHGFMWRTPK